MQGQYNCLGACVTERESVLYRADGTVQGELAKSFVSRVEFSKCFAILLKGEGEFKLLVCV